MSTSPRAALRYPEIVVWIAVTIGIPAWAFHLVFEAAMAHYTAVHPAWRWTLHLVTAVTALVTLAGMAICFDLWRASRPSEPVAARDDDISPAQLGRFLGALGLLVGAANLALILLEGSYVIFLSRRG